MEKFVQALSYLLPQGFAWPRDLRSTLMRVLRAIAGGLSDLHEFTRLTVFQWQPHQTVTRLAEWEEATGLPDACFGPDQDEATRRMLLLARLRGPVLEYADSSPASPGAIVAICAWLGYEATVVYNTPFRCGTHRVGDRLGVLDGVLYVTVTITATRFRVKLSRVGERLLQDQLTGEELACYLRRVVPARYDVQVSFV